MKKFLVLLLVLLCASTLLCSCGNRDFEEAMGTDIEEVIVPEKTVDPFYEKMVTSDKRPIAIMIDNDADYNGPQAGLENAYLMYEAYVEGGNTRMMAFFLEGSEGTDVKNVNDRIGPVRSSRHYFLDFALEHDAIYAHCGFSPRAQSEISSRGVNNINGLYDGKAFVRYSEFNNSWHNLYTTYGKLYSGARDSYNYRLNTERKGLSYLPEKEELASETLANRVYIPYLANKVEYNYDAESGTYLRWKRGNPHTMQSGVQLSATNIVILEMQNVDLNDGEGKGRQDLYTTGSGKGQYITRGKAVNIKWSRENRSSRTVYTYEDGTEVKFNPGQTYIQIVPPAMELTIE